MTIPQQHDDPFGEGIGKVLQALAVLTTVGEAAARFAATGAHNRAAKSERQTNTERVAASTQQQADLAAQRTYAAQQRADRKQMDLAFDDEWLANADIDATASLWRTAALYGMSGDKRATEAMRRAQERLAQLNPGLVDAFTLHRAAGLSVADAMRTAATEVWHHQTRTTPPSPRGNLGQPPAPALSPDALTAPTDDGEHPVDGRFGLEAATRAEVARLAKKVDPEVLDRLQRQWRSAGHSPAADAAAALAGAGRRAETQLHALVGGSDTARRRVDEATDHDQPRAAVTVETVDGPMRFVVAAHQDADRELDGAAPTMHASQAAEHLTGLAQAQQRSAAIDQSRVDNRATILDEYRDGLAASQVSMAGAQHDLAAADQQRRLARAFPPLGRLNPIFSHAPTVIQPATARRKGSAR